MLSKLFLIVVFNILTYLSFAQDTIGHDNSSPWLKKIDSPPNTIFYFNSLEVENRGGHLQGIQVVDYKEQHYFILSGSSSSYAYYAIVKSGKENMVISVNKILDKPYKHAGGFQIRHHLMAIGVEDNDQKNKSKVFIFDMKNPEKPPQKPLAIIDRMGTFKRATAGCVGITTIKGKVLVVVGDWDTEHLDFYRIDEEKLLEEGASLELEYSINTKSMDRSTWIDKAWQSYQNINLLQDDKQNLFLAGMTSNEAGDVIDIFSIETSDLSSFSLRKTETYTFTPTKHTKFRYGAGINMDNNQKLMILSCGEHIENNAAINIYQTH